MRFEFQCTRRYGTGSSPSPSSATWRSVTPANYPLDSTIVVQDKKGLMVEPPEVPAGV